MAFPRIKTMGINKKMLQAKYGSLIKDAKYKASRYRRFGTARSANGAYPTFGEGLKLAEFAFNSDTGRKNRPKKPAAVAYRQRKQQIEDEKLRLAQVKDTRENINTARTSIGEARRWIGMFR